MHGLVISRRAVLEGAAGVAVAAGLPAAAVAASAPLERDVASAAMIAAWVRVHPEAGATIRLACLDAERRLIRELLGAALEASETMRCEGPVSLWRQAQDAAEVAQTLVVSALASAWGVPSRECEIRSGAVAHGPSGQAMKHTVWVDVV